MATITHKHTTLVGLIINSDATGDICNYVIELEEFFFSPSFSLIVSKLTMMVVVVVVEVE